MRVVASIFWKELRSYFLSPIAYVVLTGFTAISGFLFYQMVNFFIRLTTLIAGYEDKIQRGRELNLADDLMGPLFKNLNLFLLILVPAITMRLFAEEKKLKTEELLLTCPIRMGQVVMGKYLASLVLLVLMLVPVGVYTALILGYGYRPDPGTILAGYLGLFLVAFSLSAVGIFSSTLTENQIIAFFVCAVLGIFFFTIGIAGNSVGTVTLFSYQFNLGEFFRQLSLLTHFDNFVSGRIYLSDLIYFFSMIVFFLFVSRSSAESARWG